MNNLEWVYYEDLLKEYPENRLRDLLRTGKLQPFDMNGEKLYCPKECHEYFYYMFVNKARPPETVKRITEISDTEPDLHRFDDYHPNQHTKLSWKFLRVPKDEAKKEALQLILKDSKFQKSEFERVETELSGIKNNNVSETVPPQGKPILRNTDRSKILVGKKAIEIYYEKEWQTAKKHLKKAGILRYNEQGKPTTTTFEIDEYRLKTAT